MDEDHDCDPDQPPAGAAAGASPCSCCSTPCAVATWRRSVKRKLGEKGDGEGKGEGAVVLARVEAEEEAAALREAVAAAQETAAALRSEVEEERVAAASAASEGPWPMMLRLQREKAEVQMELRQFRRFADEKMALDAAEIDHLRAALARRARHLARLRSTLREYRHTCLRLGIPLAEGDQADELP
ncbi:hypothetical protein OsJ_11923 [Oryza sativa Japonica Group]|uniref:GTD-binding domain-containing protein n=1 Tax=Oryza sativa subsp. japonica TaxID=39947 RepID=B9FA26_ORYSJ|nr:hypothetical protein OsJ_11923 [Oryza sativa Japonica Group]